MPQQNSFSCAMGIMAPGSSDWWHGHSYGQLLADWREDGENYRPRFTTDKKCFCSWESEKSLRPHYRKQFWMRYNLNLNTRTMRSHHHLKGTLGKEENAASTSKGCLVCSGDCPLSMSGTQTDSMSSLRTYCVHQSLRSHSVDRNW